MQLAQNHKNSSTGRVYIRILLTRAGYGTQDRGFEHGGSRRIFRMKNSIKCLPSEGK
jgi:hypothetical protein